MIHYLFIPWWPGVLAIPAALLASIGVFGGVTRFIVLIIHKDRSAEALRAATTSLQIAGEIREQYVALSTAHVARIKEQDETNARLLAKNAEQHNTNIDIDRRLHAITSEKTQLARHISELDSHITDQDLMLFEQDQNMADLKTNIQLQEGRLQKMETERASLRSLLSLLQAERDKLRQRVEMLEAARAGLIQLLQEHGITVPPELQADVDTPPAKPAGTP